MLYFVTREQAELRKQKQRIANKKYWNTENGRAYHEKYKRENKELYREAVKKYRKKNRASHRKRASAARARRALATSPDHNELIELTLFNLARRLEACTRMKFHLDHVVPIARNGKHHHANMRVLPATLNSRKSNLLDEECPAELQLALRAWTVDVHTKSV